MARSPRGRDPVKERGALRLALLVACTFFLAAPMPERPSGLGDVVDVRHWSYGDYTRVVVELTRPTDTEGKKLAAATTDDRPERLYFDLPNIWVGRSYSEAIAVRDGLLQGVRLGQNDLRTTRVVLDLANYDRHRLMVLHSPHRIVIDVFGRQQGSEDAPPLPMELRPVRTVVIDPGHGGKDPGAIGVGGLQEKGVTLALSKALRTALTKRGFNAVLTREDDRYLSLLERTALAEGAGGDVFLSVHANAAKRRAAEGVEIYTLDQGSERQTVRLAARENGVSPTEVDPLQHLLAQLRLSEVSERSTFLAKLVHEELVRDMSSRWPSVADARIRKGPFYVLYLSDMPSMLLEADFLTHRRGAKRLRDPKYLQAIADEVADAVARYRSEPMVIGRNR